MSVKRYFFLYGGLGNQMFQLNIALIRKIDFNDYIVLELGLNEGKISNVFDFESIKNTGVLIKNRPFFSKLVLLFSKIKFVRKMFSISNSYDLEVRKFNIGYWQNCSLFKKEYMQNLLSFSLTSNISNDLLVHIRSGDYHVGKNSRIYYQLSLDYYIKAINLILRNQTIDKIFIFSNSKSEEVVLKNFLLQHFDRNKVQISIQVDDSVNDLQLFRNMLSCNNFVIANSSLSLAASLFVNEKNCIKIGPINWFKKDIFSYTILDKFFYEI